MKKAQYLWIWVIFAAVIGFAACEKDDFGVEKSTEKGETVPFALRVAEPTGDIFCSTPLMAGQHLEVGEVTVTHDSEYLTVAYMITDLDWEIVDVHLALSTDPVGEGEWLDNKWQNRSGNPAPGQFPYHFDDGDMINGMWTITIPLADIGPDGAEVGDEFCIGAHAVVRNNSDHNGETETAWGEGERFRERGNWAMYFCCTIFEIPDPTPEPVIIFGATTVGETGTRALYEINMANQAETLIFEVPQTGNVYQPNGLAYDEANDRLYYAMGNELYFFDRSSGDNTHAGTINGISYGAVFADESYWYIENNTSNLYAVTFDADGLIAGGLDAPFDSGFTNTNLMFGDLAYDPEDNVIYGSTTNGPGYFFKYDLNAEEGERYHQLGTAGGYLQLALVEDGTLFGHHTTSAQFYVLDKNADEAPVELFVSNYKYNDLAPGPKNN